MKFYLCPKCSSRVFFENLVCLQCKTGLGYVVDADTMVPLTDNMAPDAWIPCANRESLFCNWVLESSQAKSVSDENIQESSSDKTAAPGVLCDCCRYTRTIPSQQQSENQLALRKFELAKRYLFYSLHRLHLPLPDRMQQPDSGLVFDFMVQLPGQPKLLTGHTAGVIVINAVETDDAKREQRRASLNEPYRTVLGHLRHEVGHFYWDQLIANSSYLDKFRKIFGDERVDYDLSLRNHYARVDIDDWHDHHISYYASAHPWEDWAESWAHYLHIYDALDTAKNWGVVVANGYDENQLLANEISVREFHNRLVKVWLPLSQYLNAACRSLGEPDAYPFTLQEKVIDKLGFIHQLIHNPARQ